MRGAPDTAPGTEGTMPGTMDDAPDMGIMPEEESDEAYDFRSGGLEMLQKRPDRNDPGCCAPGGACRREGRCGRNDHSLPNLIEVLLYDEIHRRRRRRRGRHSWYFGR